MDELGYLPEGLGHGSVNDYGFNNPAKTESDIKERVRFYDNHNVHEWAAMSEVLGWSIEEYEL